jgi:addiction module RelE/StbE family toxin
MSYQIVVHPDVHDALKKLNKKDNSFYQRVKKKILELSKNPEIGKPLSNVLKGCRRVQIGHFVLIYEFKKAENTITILNFEHHDNAY